MGELVINPKHNIFKQYRKVNLVNPYIFKNDKAEWRFDTVGSNPSDLAFRIIRADNNATMDMTYANITDGTYAAFVAGTTGQIMTWYSGSKSLSNIQGYTMNFVPNSGNPYFQSVSQSTGLHGGGVLSKFSNDWIVSIIHGKELNANNQRLTLGITGDVLYKNILIQAVSNNKSYYTINANSGTAVPNTNSINITTTDKFDVYTYANIGGVLTIRKNNTVLTKLGPNATYTVRMSNAVVKNSVSLNNISQGSSGTSGKLNKYQHIGHIADKDLSGFDLTGYINSLISRYGIT